VDTTVSAALIGAIGTIIAAVITARLSRSAEGKIQAGHAESSAQRRNRFLKLLLVVGLLSIIVAIAIMIALYDWTGHRIRAALGSEPGFHQVVYDRVGLGLLLPDQWSVDDASFRFGGGDIDLVRDYDPQFKSISQGIKLRFLSVQKNYVNSPNDEFGNEEATLKDIDPQVQMIDATINGRPAKRFIYKQKAGERFDYIERTWVHLAPRVKLEIVAVSDLDDNARDIFNRERDRIIESIVIDAKKVSELSGGT
jgi:hypothetical protein